MRKKLPVLLPVLAALALTACGTPAAAPQPGSTPAAQPPAASDAGALRVLTAGTNAGMYLPVTAEGDPDTVWPVLLSWVDYAAARQVVLCSRPNCDHSDESCPARLPDGAGEVGCYALEDGLLVKFSVSDPETFEITGQYLYLCAADGSNPRLLAQAATNWDFLADGQAVYYSAQQVTGEGPDAPAETVWYRQPLDGGQAEEVFRCDIGDMLLGCAGRELVQASWFDNTVYAAGLDTGERRTLPVSPADASGFAMLGERLYWLAADDPGTLHWLEPASGQDGTLDIQWPDGAAPAGSINGLSAAAGRLLLEVGDGAGNYSRLAIDPASGSASEVPLQFVDGKYLQPVRILGEGDGELYVQYESRMEPATLTGKNGEPVPGEVQTARTAMIPVEDFFAGVPNYRDVSTLPPAA